MHFILFIFSLFIFYSNAQSVEMPEKFKLVSSSCNILSGVNGEVKTKNGSLTGLYCVKKNNFFCSQGTPEVEEYLTLKKHSDNIIILRSLSGNNFLKIDFKNKKFEIGETHYVDDYQMIINKHCVGLVKTY